MVFDFCFAVAAQNGFGVTEKIIWVTGPLGHLHALLDGGFDGSGACTLAMSMNV